MAKRLKRIVALRPCNSSDKPLLVYSRRPSPFSFYEDDVWIEISKYLDGKSLVKLSSTCKWFNKIVSEECVWKYACLRDLRMPDPGNVSFIWKKLYASAFDGTHSYLFRQKEKHKEWIRLGAFFMDSPAALLTEKLAFPRRIYKNEAIEKMLGRLGLCVLTNIKTGIWIADLQYVRCPACDFPKCEGVMQVLDARHFELFLNDDYQNGSWEFTQIGSHETKKHIEAASGAIFDLKNIVTPTSITVFKTKTWFRKQEDCRPRAIITPYAVAFNTNLRKNGGLNVKFHVMRAGTDGPIVAIRISQQLL